ncbi:MAG: hypothetical protein ACO1TE_16285 [Prosthecobacter sp.]
MTRPKAVFAGIFIGLLGCAALGAAGWHFLLREDGPQIPQMLPRKWWVNEPGSLSRETVCNDVWFFPDTPLIEPASIQRVEWGEASVLGRDGWGYHVFHKARVVDAALAAHLLRVALPAGGRAPLPSWAAHVPKWWHPERSVPTAELSQLKLQSNDIFIESRGPELFIYWIREPFEGSV